MAHLENFLGKKLESSLDENLKIVKKIFLRDAILRIREMHCGGSIDTDVAAVYFDGMVNTSVLNDSIIRPIMDVGLINLSNENEKAELYGKKSSQRDARKAESDAKCDAKSSECDASTTRRGEDEKNDAATDIILRRVLYSNELKKTDDWGEILRSIMYGDTLILVDGCNTALVANTKGWKTRGISEPEDERILEGPREGFSESSMINLSLLRRKLKTPDLCIEHMQVGRRTDTHVYVCYLGSLAPRRVVKEIKRRIGALKIDGIFDTNYIAELCSGRNFSLFRSSGSTERPDIVAARLLEGRVAVITDGSPMVLTLPYLFSENFQSDEDYYQNFLTAGVGRLLRYLCFFLSVSLPGIYIALTVFHRRLLPTAFLLALTEARLNVPFSSVTECVVLIIVFEILKEAGVRTQQSLGTALSIVGGLVVGQAAVEAKIVSAPMLIVVALSGIAGLMVPRLRAAVFYLRFAVVIASSIFGIYGYILCIFAILVSILSLKTFGFDSTPALSGLDFQQYKDTFIRAPLWKMKLRPKLTSNRIRMRYSKKEDGDYAKCDAKTNE